MTATPQEIRDPETTMVLTPGHTFASVTDKIGW